MRISAGSRKDLGAGEEYSFKERKQQVQNCRLRGDVLCSTNRARIRMARPGREERRMTREEAGDLIGSYKPD